MLLRPKRTLYRKLKKSYLTNQLVETKNNTLKFGRYGIKVLEATRMTARQIESIRQCVNRNLKRKGKLWITIFPHIPVTQKPTENRMGKGKGAIAFWTSQVEAGQILFELTTNSPDIALQASKTISRMASIPVCLIKKEQPL